MKHLKHIYEMVDDWATSNRLADKIKHTEITEETVIRSLDYGPPMRVKIAKTSIYYKDNDMSNPKGVIGSVIEFDKNNWLPIKVQWDNHYTAYYNCKDIELE